MIKKDIKLSDLSPEQYIAIKEGLRQQIEKAMNSRGVKTERGDVIPKYAFLKKKNVKRIKKIMALTTAQGKKVYVRIF
jgi:hypothetical protein